MRGLTLIAAPTEEPITLEEGKAHCRIDADITAHDALITELIATAREQVEAYTGRALVEQTWEIAYDSGDWWDGYYPMGIFLPKPPLIEVMSYAYVDTNGAAQTLAADQYTVDVGFPARPRLVPAYGATWPAVRSVPGALKIRYVAGYARAGSPPELERIPRRFVTAMKLLLSHWNENREATARKLHELPFGVRELLDPLRVEGMG